MNEDKLKEIHEDGRKLALLQIHKAGLDNFAECSKAMTEMLKMALRGTFILNGVAIIPIVYSKVDYLYPCAILFGYGALFSVMGTITFCFEQPAYKAIWKKYFSLDAYDYLEGKICDRFAELVSRAEKIITILQVVLYVSLLLSLLFFWRGLHQASEAIEKQKAPQPESILLTPNNKQQEFCSHI